MKVYNREMIDKVKSVLDFEYVSDEELAERLFKIMMNSKVYARFDKFSCLGCGSDRAAYLVKGTDVVVKIATGCKEEEYDEFTDFQGLVEQCTYEKYLGHVDSMYEIYGISDNCMVIFCEYLETSISYNEAIESGMYDLVEFLAEKGDFEEVPAEDLDDAWWDCYSYIEDFFERYYDCPFRDIHEGNIGYDKKNGTLKILDLGYGDGGVAREVYVKFIGKKQFIGCYI